MVTISAGQKNLSTYLKNSFEIEKKTYHRQTVWLGAMKFYEQENMCFIHVHTKSQLYSITRGTDIADLLLDVFFSKMPLFQKNAIFKVNQLYLWFW